MERKRSRSLKRNLVCPECTHNKKLKNDNNERIQEKENEECLTINVKGNIILNGSNLSINGVNLDCFKSIKSKFFEDASFNTNGIHFSITKSGIMLNGHQLERDDLEMLGLHFHSGDHGPIVVSDVISISSNSSLEDYVDDWLQANEEKPLRIKTSGSKNDEKRDQTEKKDDKNS